MTRNTGVPDDGQEPDYQLSLSAERTYLAYVRTSLTLIAGGVAAVAALPNAGQVGLRRAIGVLLILSGLFVAVVAPGRWRALDAAMRQHGQLPRNRAAVVMTATLVVVSVLALVLVVVV